MQYWLAKTEPETYGFDHLVKDGSCVWDGVRNYQARNYLKEMELGDKVLIYHSGIERAIVGLASVSKTFFQDPTTQEEAWVAVEMKPIDYLENTVSLQAIKQTPELAELGLVKNGRLSVMPLSGEEYDLLIKMSQKKINN